MKTKTLILLCLCFLILGMGQLNSQPPTASLTTPKGYSFYGYSTSEIWSYPDKLRLDTIFAEAYPNCTLQGTATSTSTYNCHSYAWNMSEGGPTCWIGYYSSSEEDVYWTDGSYVETTEPYASKISYYADDHSARQTSTQGWYISKWGDKVLMLHARDDGPAGYCMGYRKYYRLNPGINGSTSLMCDNDQRTFTSNMSIPGSTYTWSRATSLDYVSGAGTTGYTVEANNGNGDSYVGLQISTPSGEVATASYKVLYVGVPIITYISGSTYTPNYQWATYYAQPNNPLMGANDYNWILNPLLDNVVYDYGWTADIAFYSSGNYQLVVRAQNTCGWGDYTVTGVEVYDQERLSISPNPASGEFTLTIESLNEELPVSGWDLEIFDPNLRLIQQKTKLKDNRTVINTSGWQEGIYFVRVRYNNKLLTGKVIVKR